ncbi:helix-turn-helix domain-containing protein [Treponema parvum]|uniref:Helix-turn-helix domain-containing protein n=1 Tax=Treponema parvum TaxID=138851 RepID=A0A975F3N6_9SPIR|nr:helix-turn-helix domain-containing protein [Treponema parvum]QTQ14044.1 helix-turn-helix domain-containing protein [Treponema parvum]
MNIGDSRIISILNVLLDAHDYISSVVIAEKIDASESTFFRLLPQIEKYIQPYDLSLVKLRGKGFMLTGSKNAKETLINDFESKNYSREFSLEEKSFLVLLYLLNEKDTVKIASLARCLNISETGVSKILTELEQNLKKSGCVILRKRGVGTYISGNEIAARQAALNTACLYLNFNEFMSLLYTYIHEPAIPENRLKIYTFTCAVFEYLNEKTHIRRNFDFVEKIETLSSTSFSDIDFVLLFLCVSIMEFRCANGFFVAPRKNDKAHEDDQISAEIKQSCRSLHFLKDKNDYAESETLFFTEILQSTEAAASMFENQKHYGQIAGNFVSFIEASLDGYVTEHKKVAYIVYLQIMHLLKNRRQLFSMQKYTASFAENILNKDNRIQKIVKPAADFLQSRLRVDVSEEEAGVLLSFIAPFFRSNIKKISAVLVCASGIVVSSILKERICKEFPELDLIETVSVRKLTDSYIKEKGIDFIISVIDTVPLSVPAVYISVQLDGSDIQKIKNILKNR